MLKLFDLLAERLPLSIVAWFGALVAAIGMSTSKVLLSIGLITVVASAFVYWIHRRAVPSFLFSGWVGALAAISFISLIGFAYTLDTGRWVKDFTNKLPFLALPLAWFALPKLSPVKIAWIWLAYITTQAGLGAWALTEYLRETDIAHELIRTNASIDIPGSISHIYFSMTLAVGLFASLALLRSYRFSQLLKGLLLAAALFQFLLMHVLTSRTGLAAMYSGLTGWGIYEVATRRAWKLGSLIAGLLVLTPLLAYQYVYAFRTRVQVTFWDLQQYQLQTQDMSHLSAARRLFAWQAAWDAFTAHPILGVGMGDVRDRLYLWYAKKSIPVSSDQWLANAHNGYLQALAGTGLLGFSANVLALLLAAWAGWKLQKPLMIAIAGAFSAGLLFEALWQREIGVCLFVFSLIWAFHMPKINENQPFYVK